MELRTIDTRLGPIACRTAGADGPPALLLHGWGGSSRYWAGAREGLGGGRRLAAPDLPGFGDTPPRTAADLASLAQSALAVADAFGWEQFALAGHSFGAAVGVVLAATHPERVGRLALVSTGIARSPGELALYAGIGAQLGLAAAVWAPWVIPWRPWAALSRPWRQLAASTSLLPALLAGPVLAPASSVPTAAVAAGVADLVAMDALAGLQSAASISSPIVAALATRVACPTLVITGAADRIAPPSAAAVLAAAIPGAKLQVIPACGHIPMAERPAELYGALRGFMAGE